MFNSYIYEHKKEIEDKKIADRLRSNELQEKAKVFREELCENYSKRISDFLLHMQKEPIKLNDYLPPLENTGRVSDPNKFKGKARFVIKDYKNYSERILVLYT
jgi:hypothetical protein